MFSVLGIFNEGRVKKLFLIVSETDCPVNNLGSIPARDKSLCNEFGVEFY